MQNKLKGFWFWYIWITEYSELSCAGCRRLWSYWGSFGDDDWRCDAYQRDKASTRAMAAGAGSTQYSDADRWPACWCRWTRRSCTGGIYHIYHSFHDFCRTLLYTRDPLTSTCHIWHVMLVWRKGNIEKTVSVLQYCVLLEWYTKVRVMKWPHRFGPPWVYLFHWSSHALCCWQDVFRVIGNWGERHVFLFRKAFIISKKRKDGFLQVKVIIKVVSCNCSAYSYVMCRRQYSLCEPRALSSCCVKLLKEIW